MRDSFLVPIPELDQAIELLSQATDALLHGERDRAARCLKEADSPTIMTYFKRVVGPNDPAIHGTSTQPKTLPKAERDESRMPGEKEQQAIFVRDGWRCRFCDTRVISKRARDVFRKVFPDEAKWVSSEYERHSALLVLAASLDHIVPHSRGGTNEPANLVTTCTPCNFGRGAWTLDEVRLSDPRTRTPPIHDGWDGLTRLTAYRAP
jgi:5-methylcytosine-specific restriction endonuclease McrA